MSIGQIGHLFGNSHFGHSVILALGPCQGYMFMGFIFKTQMGSNSYPFVASMSLIFSKTDLGPFHLKVWWGGGGGGGRNGR